MQHLSCNEVRTQNMNAKHFYFWKGFMLMQDSREVFSECADEMSSKHTPHRETATCPGHHDNAAVRRPTDELNWTCFIMNICEREREGGEKKKKIVHHV